MNRDVDVVVIGAGFAGIYALHALREQGFTVATFEAGTNVGGTWFWNRYPGARCDVESLDYQYSFSEELATEWTWTERYATQPEILAYAEWVADRLDLRRHITFETRVDGARFDEESSTWRVSTSDGAVTTARFVVTAAGSISATSVPPFAGAESFRGETYHPGRWPAEGVDFTGKRVAVIGVGSSGVQLIPHLADAAGHLTVFQRTPAYTVPARNRALCADEITLAKKNHAVLAEQKRRTFSGINLPMTGDAILATPEPKRTTVLEQAWKLGGNLFLTAFSDVQLDLDANELMAAFVRDKIAAVVDDPATARALTPTDYPIGGKRIVTDTDFYATFNRPNTDVVSLREDPIVEIVPTGVRTESGLHEVDVIVYATGYDNLTGALTRIDFRGRDGFSLKDSWADGAHTYLGLATSGFPNLFTITGPQSPSVLVNMFAAIEQHVEWIVRCLTELRESGVVEIEALPESERKWGDQVEAAMAMTLYSKTNSWYRGANIAGKAQQALMYCDGLVDYRDRCDDVAADGYRGFVLTDAAALTEEEVA